MEKWNLPEGKNPQALILTAHPDDETTFAGGLMLTYPQWQWHLACVTMQSEFRQKEYEMAITVFRQKGVNIVRSHVLGKKDEYTFLLEVFKDWQFSIKKLGLKPDIVFTHNVMGEYGHPHHMFINKIAHTLYKNVWDFVFPGETAVGPQVVKAHVNKIKLTEKILKTKNDILNTAYNTDGFWEGLPTVMDYEFNKGPEVFTSD